MDFFLGTAQAAVGDFNEYFVNVVNSAVVVAGFFSVLIVVYAGFVYSRSQGDPSKISSAKELISGVLIGLAIILLIKVILPTLGITK